MKFSNIIVSNRITLNSIINLIKNLSPLSSIEQTTKLNAFKDWKQSSTSSKRIPLTMEFTMKRINVSVATVSFTFSFSSEHRSSATQFLLNQLKANTRISCFCTGDEYKKSWIANIAQLNCIMKNMNWSATFSCCNLDLVMFYIDFFSFRRRKMFGWRIERCHRLLLRFSDRAELSAFPWRRSKASTKRHWLFAKSNWTWKLFYSQSGEF